MECAYTGTEPKCRNLSTGMGTIIEWLVIECAYTGTEPKCRNAITGTGNIKCQYR